MNVCVCFYVSCMCFYILVTSQMLARVRAGTNPARNLKLYPGSPCGRRESQSLELYLPSLSYCDWCEPWQRECTVFIRNHGYHRNHTQNAKRKKLNQEIHVLAKLVFQMSRRNPVIPRKTKPKHLSFVGLPIRKPKMSHSSGNERLVDINVNPHKEIKKPN